VNRNHKIALVLVLLALTVATPGCGVINKLRAKNSLNDGVREFNKGRYDLAEEKFSHALLLSPDLANAGLFRARAIYQQYDQKRGDELANKTLDAYQEVADKNKGNDKVVDTALAFKADVFDKLHKSAIEKGDKAKAEEYKKKQHDTLLQRATLPGATEHTKAAVYYTIGQGYWQEAYNLSRYAINYDATLKQPIPQERADQMRPNIQKALEYLNKAVEQDPEYADAWSYKKLTLLQESYITTDPMRKTALAAEIKAADEKTKSLYEKRKQAEAEQQQSGAAK
jgi:tetratricopeptide (TPR) repeat protein